MLKRVLFILALLMPIASNADLQPGPLVIVVVGTKDAVYSVLNEAMNIEFSRGFTVPISTNVGFQSRFKGFITGQTEVKAWLIPVADGDASEPTAFSIGFSWQTQRNDGKTHIASLISQIKTIAVKHGDVVVADNVSSYRDMGDQQKNCLTKLDNDPLLTSIKDKVALGFTDKTSFSMLANDAIPTDEERKVIFDYANKKDFCNTVFDSVIPFFPNNPVTLMSRTVRDIGNQLNMALYKGQLTYGNYAKIRKENVVRFEEVRLKILAEMQAKDTDANDRAQRLALEEQRVLIEQQKIYANLYRPVLVDPVKTRTSTNCQVNGNQMNCTTF